MNDERPIEKLLRRYAKKRAADAGTPPELHPATRRLLQGEVARQFQRRATDGPKASPGTFFQGWLPWLGMAAAVIVVLSFGAWIFYDGGKPPTQLASSSDKNQPAKFQLAKNEAAEKLSGNRNNSDAQSKLTDRLQPASIPVPIPTSLEPSAPLIADNSMARTEEVNVGELEKKFPAARSLSAPKPAEIVAGENTRTASSAVTSRDKTGFAGSPAMELQSIVTNSVERRSDAPPRVATTADALYTKAPILARGGGLERERAKSVVQSYANVATAPRYANIAQSAPVLANFQVEQSGSQLRVIDADGSTYSGEVTAAENFPGATGGGGGKGAAELKKKTFVPIGAAAPMLAPGKLSATSQEQGQNYFYRVAGTNRTLNQQVVFTWNFVGTTNDAGARQFQEAAGALNKDGAESQSLLPNSPINGRARLGAGKEIEINATPVK